MLVVMVFVIRGVVLGTWVEDGVCLRLVPLRWILNLG